jgi:hypothetical protein
MTRHDEHRSRRGETARLDERLIGEQQPVLAVDGEGPETEPAGSGAARHFPVGGMPILGRAQGLADLRGEGTGDAGIPERGHIVS